jgi:hypothetical protein
MIGLDARQTCFWVSDTVCLGIFFPHLMVRNMPESFWQTAGVDIKTTRAMIRVYFIPEGRQNKLNYKESVVYKIAKSRAA